jgi:OOP family OmpA-OmpF porin
MRIRKEMFVLFFVLFLIPGLKAPVLGQQILVKGEVTSYKTKLRIPATVYFEKQPDASVTVISEAGPEGFKARIYYRGPFLIKVSSPGFISEYQEIDLSADSVKDKWEFTFGFSLVPIQIGEILPFNNLLFDVTSYRISNQSIPELERLADILIENPGIKICLEGHTDNQSKSRQSIQLSKKRIQAIRKFLVSKGIQPERIRLKAIGGGGLVVQTDGPDARRINRRVDIRIIEM